MPLVQRQFPDPDEEFAPGVHTVQTWSEMAPETGEYVPAEQVWQLAVPINEE
jgi:hypothetical protein